MRVIALIACIWQAEERNPILFSTREPAIIKTDSRETKERTSKRAACRMLILLPSLARLSTHIEGVAAGDGALILNNGGVVKAHYKKKETQQREGKKYVHQSLFKVRQDN